jgi:histidinol-phosphate phosphatase family protein
MAPRATKDCKTMIRSLWIAKTGMESQQNKLDAISNNLANVGTNGFKRGGVVFEDLMYQNLRPAGSAWIDDRLAEGGAHVDAVYHCPHHPTAGVGEYRVSCDCRKPGPGMLLAAIAEWEPDVGRSFLLGDKESDVQAAEAAGVRGVLYTGGDLRDVVRSLIE